MSVKPPGIVPCALPPAARGLCATLGAPPRLRAHLALVHAAAAELVDGLARACPGLAFAAGDVCFGAATHDLGKVAHPAELTAAGDRHEAIGPGLLERHGVSPALARFARTHGAWSREELPLEDLLVALADTAWSGRRCEPLEDLVVGRIAAATGRERWAAFARLDGVLDGIARRGDERLALHDAHGSWAVA